jgi:hypothetical protein
VDEKVLSQKRFPSALFLSSKKLVRGEPFGMRSNRDKLNPCNYFRPTSIKPNGMQEAENIFKYTGMLPHASFFYSSKSQRPVWVAAASRYKPNSGVHTGSTPLFFDIS